MAQIVGAEGFSRAVAIKRVLPGYSENPQFAQMFVSEARLSSRLQHPNIVSIMDFDRDAEGRLFLVMELVDGTDLDGLLQTGPLPFPLIVFLLGEVLRGLGYAHDLPVGGDGVRGVVHRDVSPHNVLLSWEGAVKVSDFGIAKARAASNATATDMIKGKPAYMSPEQANGEPLDGTSDLFAVGVMMWEMLCGRTLFAGASTQETLARLLFAPIPSPRQLRADVPADLDRIVMRLLARERAQRYPNADAAIADLVACQDHPRSGRELLITVLEQRFAGRMPARSRRAIDSGIVSAADLGRGSAPVTAPHGVALPGPVAPTSMVTTEATPRSRAWLAGLLVGGTVLAVITIAVATSAQSPDTSSTVSPTAPPQQEAQTAAPPNAPSSTPPATPPAKSVAPPTEDAVSPSSSADVTAVDTPPAGRGSAHKPSTAKRRPASSTSSTGIKEVNLGGN